MNEITNINDSTHTNNEKSHEFQLHTGKEQIDSNFKSLTISMIQIRQILNILNSQFYNSSNSVPDTSQTPIKLYYELYQTIVKSLKPIEIAIQNNNISLATSISKFETLYFKFISDFIELLLMIDLPKELFNPICTFFSPLLVIFMRNLINEKTDISFDDFSLIAQLNQGSFSVFDSILKKLYTNCFDKLDLLSELIKDDGSNDNKKNETLKGYLDDLRKSLIWKKKNPEQYQTILNSVLSIRCELISHRQNKIKAGSILAEIESSAHIGSYLYQAQKSTSEFLDFLNESDTQELNVSTYFSSLGDLQPFYEKVNKLQLLELERLNDENFVTIDFFNGMKSILSNIFDFQNDSTYEQVPALVNIQLYNNHYLSTEVEEDQKNQEESNVDLKKKKKEEFDLNLRKKDPPSDYEQCITTFLEFIQNIEIGGELPLTLEKDMLILQFTEVVSTFTKDKSSRPIKNETDYITSIVNKMTILVNKIIAIYESNNSDSDSKTPMFLLAYVNSINILLIAKEKYQNSEQFETIINAFRDLIPPPAMLRRMLNIEALFKKLQQTSRFLIESSTQSSPNPTSDEAENDQYTDQQLNTTSIYFYGSNDTAIKLTTELELASLILSFVELNEQFVNKIGCSEFPNRIWPQKTVAEGEENDDKDIYFDENGYNASLALLSLFRIEGFNFDYSPDFFINWIIFNFSTINTRIQATPIPEFVPFCDYSELCGKIIDSCTLIDLYARINNSEALINAAETIKLSTLAIFLSISTSYRLDEAQLSQQIQACIRESSNSSVFKKINILCHTVFTKIHSFFQIFEFIRYTRSTTATKVGSTTQIDIFNYSIEIMNKLKSIANSECLPDDFRESIFAVASKIAQVIADPETCSRPLFFTQGVDDQLIYLFSILNEARKTVDKFDIMMIVTQVSNYINEILTFYEAQQEENVENSKYTFSLDVFNAIFALKREVDELIFANKRVNSQVFVMKMQLILEKAEKMIPKLDQPLHELYEIINVSYSIYSIKTMLNFAYFSVCQYSKNGIAFENWFEGEFNENSIFCKEDENIDTTFTDLLKYINILVGGISELQNRINNVLIENNYQENSNENDNSGIQLNMKKKKLDDLNGNFQFLANDLKTKISRLNNRKIHPDVPQLEQECRDLINQFVTFPIQPPNLANIYKKIQLKIHPSSDKLVTQFESESLEMKLKNIKIKEMERKVDLLKEELNKKQKQINQSFDSSIADTKKKQLERSDQIIKLIREAVTDNNDNENTNNIFASVDNNNNHNDDNDGDIDDVSPDDPNFETCQKLRKHLDEINQENLALKNEIRELELRHNISREDQIDLLMNKSINFPNPNITKDTNDKHSSSSGSKKDNDALNKRVNDLNQSIEKMKKKIQIDKKQGTSEQSIIKLFKDIRPRGFPETLINEDIFKQFTKTTRERADKVMKEWRMLRADLAAAEQGT